MMRKFLIFLTIISTLAIIGWMITDFFGGMIIFLLMYGKFIVPLVFIYVFTLILTIVLLFKNGIRNHRILFYTHTLGLSMIVSFCLYQSELFKSRVLLDAVLIDDLSNINLVLRKNGSFETISNGMFGYTERIKGKYKIQNDTIIFLKKPYSNDLIPDTVIIDRKEDAIFFEKESNGEFSRKKTFLNYFKINRNEI